MVANGITGDRKGGKGMPTRLLTGSEVAKRMGIDRATFYRMPDSKRPPITKIGQRKKYSEASFEAWLSKREKR